MRTFLVKTLLMGGLLFSLTGIADDSLSACLEANSDNPDKNTVCARAQLQSAIEARNKELDQQYEQAKTDLKKQQEELFKKLKPEKDISHSTNDTPVDQPTTNTATPTETEQKDDAAISKPTESTENKPTDEKKAPTPTKRQSGFGEKPKGIQWY